MGDGAWGTAGKFKGARQNYAYLSADITMATAGANKDYARLATADHQFAPIRAGASGNNMGGETSKACVTGSDGGNTAKTSNSKAGSGSSDTEIKNQLEGQAFFQVIAGQMSKQTVANAPKDSSGNTLVLSNTHKNCAANIANMLAFNTAAVVKTNAGAVPSKAVKGDKPNAISFPTWSVALGDQRQGRRLRQTREQPQHGEARLRDVRAGDRVVRARFSALRRPPPSMLVFSLLTYSFC